MNLENRRIYGEYFTPTRIFREFIYPSIRNIVYNYIWVDLFAGEGNLVLPILEHVPENERIRFFSRHIYLFDINRELVEKTRRRIVEKYGIPWRIVEEHVQVRDTLLNYPSFLTGLEYPVYHITNPPYLYIGYIKKYARDLLKYFRGENKGYQDLYQIALANDMRHGVEKMIYIIPSNFLFGYSVSNKIRMDLLEKYWIKRIVVFEKKIFQYTGTNVALVFFERKPVPRHEAQVFPGLKIGVGGVVSKRYVLKPENKYRAGTEFEEFVSQYWSPKPLNVKYYLTLKEVEENPGPYCLYVLNANRYTGSGYEKTRICVNKKLYEKIRNNILFIRTLDTTDPRRKAGLYVIREEYGVDGILTIKPYRTHPIHIFFEPQLSIRDQLMLKEYFNMILEYYREITDSEFMTTYKYSDTSFTRKYLGLTQARRLIETYPILILDEKSRNRLYELIKRRDVSSLIDFVRRVNRRGRDLLSYFTVQT